MKEYRIAAWLPLRAPFDQIAHRRLLNDMSHRHLTIDQLVDGSGLRRHEVRSFLTMLDATGLLSARDAESPDSLFGSLRPLGGWIRSALTGTPLER